jgi:hypothetical protein
MTKKSYQIKRERFSPFIHDEIEGMVEKRRQAAIDNGVIKE